MFYHHFRLSNLVYVSAVSPGVEEMIQRSNRVERENDRLREENLEMLKRILILDRTLGKLREQRLVHLLKEQDFLDLKQEVKLWKEIGAANKKCSRTRLNRYLCKVTSKRTWLPASMTRSEHGR